TARGLVADAPSRTVSSYRIVDWLRAPECGSTVADLCFDRCRVKRVRLVVGASIDGLELQAHGVGARHQSSSCETKRLLIASGGLVVGYQRAPSVRRFAEPMGPRLAQLLHAQKLLRARSIALMTGRAVDHRIR